MLNCTSEAIKSVIPSVITVGKPQLLTEPHYQFSMGVLIGITGDIRGKLLIVSNQTTFQSIGELMFGFHPPDEMLESFIGELGNMIAGNFCTLTSKEGFVVDITPPSVLMGQTKISNGEIANILSVSIDGKGEIQCVMTMEYS